MANSQAREEIDLRSGESIGHGTYGYVYKFSDVNGVFVLKIPKEPGQAEAFEQECQKLAQIKHPNVVTYFGVVDVNDYSRIKPGIKMEFCERGTLKGLIFNPTIIYSMKDISIWAEQLFGALAFVFDQHRIVHRDIKAENIFVTPDFSLKLGDFGSLKESDWTSSGTFDRGTERYRSPPEIPDPEKPNETFPKASHKNDVYSMGLVLWELVERRVVLSKFDGDFGFNRDSFLWMIFLQKLSHVEGPNCIGPTRDIVQKCTRFQRRKRPEASEILEDIKALNQDILAHNPVIPIKDPNEKRLIRPIGFNGDTNRQPIDDPHDLKSSAGAGMTEGSEIMKNHHVDPWGYNWKKRVDSFVHKFNSLNPDERSKFVHNIPNLIAKALENKKIHFHEARSHLRRLGQDDTWTNHPLEDLFQRIIELNQRNTEWDIARGLVFDLDTNALHKLFHYSGLIQNLEKLGSKLRSTTFYFRAFLSTETLQVWLLLVDDDPLEVSFIRNDFQLEFRKGAWMDNEKSKCRVGNDDLNYLEDQEIDFHEIFKKIKAQDKLLTFQAKIFLDQLVPLDESQKRTESISSPHIGSNLPVKNYLFQLRNPPRMDCRHHPKCSILKYSSGGRWIKKPKEMGIPYYSCSSHKALQYLEEWWNFCRDYPKGSLLLSDERKITSDSFIFIQFKRDNQCYTLLDHPNNYEDHELIYFLDKRGEIHKMESYFYAELELHKMESSKICKLLDEMAPEKRRYAVITKEEIFTLEPWKHLAFQASILVNQLVPLEESQQRTERISIPHIGSDLPVKNYLFQLRNLPRMDCRHHPKCSILKYSSGGRWIKERNLNERRGERDLNEMGIPYYSCSYGDPIRYLREWCNFCRFYLTDSYPFSPSDHGEISDDSFIFIQCKYDSQHYTLLDHPNNYEDHELIYYLDERWQLHKMESSKSRKLLDEMAPEMRRYAMIKNGRIFAIDQEGNRLPWRVSKYKPCASM